jgi:hypothetical protein
MLEKNRKSTKMARRHSSAKHSKKSTNASKATDELYGIGTIISRQGHNQKLKCVNEVGNKSNMSKKPNSKIKPAIKDSRFRTKSENSANHNIKPIMHHSLSSIKSKIFSGLIWDSLNTLKTPKLNEVLEERELSLLGPPKMSINTELFPLEEAIVDAMD